MLIATVESVTRFLLSARDAVEFVWSGQQGLFELAFEPSRRRHFAIDDALNNLGGHRYFAPLARKTRGSKKKHVADTGNVLWADIDLPRSVEPTPERKHELLTEIRERLASIQTAPSVVIDSGGKGFWVYLKLGESILTDEIEVLNRGLATLLGADHSHNKDRIARLPGSVNQNSGKLAEVIEFSGLVYSYDDLAFLRDRAPSSSTGSQPEGAVLPGEPSTLTTFPEFPTLSRRLWEYIDRSPRKGQYGYDRSDVEQSIFLALVYRGWTDEEIIGFANVYRLPRHLEAWAQRKNFSWTERSITKAREWVEEHPLITTTNPMCIGSETSSAYSHSDRHKALRLVTNTQTTKQLLKTWMRDLPSKPSRATAYRMLKQFKEGGYIIEEDKLCVLTDLGIHHTQTKMNYLMPLPKVAHYQASY
jgi:hypothetical protein